VESPRVARPYKGETVVNVQSAEPGMGGVGDKEMRRRSTHTRSTERPTGAGGAVEQMREKGGVGLDGEKSP
jgi:hypothetical protein